MVRVVRLFSSYLALLAFAFLISQGPVLAHAEEEEGDPIRTKLDGAKKAHRSAIEKVRKSVMDHLDKREQTARREGDKKLVDQIKAERQQFETTRQVPGSTPAAVRRQVADARSSLEKAYLQAIKDYTKSKKDDEATAVEKEYKRFKSAAGKLEPADRARELLIGKWAWGENTMVLLQDGMASELNPKGGLVSKGKWKVEKDVLLVELKNGFSCRGVLREDGKLVMACTAPTGAKHTVEATKKKEK